MKNAEDARNYFSTILKEIEQSSTPDILREQYKESILIRADHVAHAAIEGRLNKKEVIEILDIAHKCLPPPDMSGEPFYSAPV